ncbi:DNA gyrase inhibitor YacG [Sphingosinicella terrae]|uniref:DNA gyrase inhibitor YacG n=1 Tax=Sphingosinicella terrae TaxID=2172047 RepID=UPI000E0CF52E|nr:DNA gyrase inhibitor YacG [Sphingosinicella terrae]
MSSAVTPERGESCPLCGRPSDPVHRPFCGQGCRDRDLLNWLGDAYRVPGAPAAPDDFAGDQDGLDRAR